MVKSHSLLKGLNRGELLTHGPSLHSPASEGKERHTNVSVYSEDKSIKRVAFVLNGIW